MISTSTSPQHDILVVDDTPANLRLLEGLLRTQGYRVRPVPTGELALRAVESAPPDLILLDVNLPDMPGMEVCRRLRQMPALADVAVIFISALADTADKLAGFSAGGVDYITKPFQAEEVLARVRTHLSLLDMRRQVLHQHQALAESHSQLEYRVQERTAELRQLNDSLAREVAERRRAERELSITASVFRDSREAIFIADGTHHYLRVNQAFLDITGFSAEDITGQPVSLLACDRHGGDFLLEAAAALRSDGHWQGETWLRRRNGTPFPAWMHLSSQREAPGEPLQTIGIFSDISDRKASEERIHRLAHYDLLTDLPNRLLFTEHCTRAISRARRDGRAMALLFIDLDGFKHINDSLGHPAGDAVLRQAARRLTAQLREEDTLARLGGDEFLGIAEGLTSPVADASAVAQKLLAAFRTPFEIEGRELRLTASIGIALYPDDALDVTTLTKNADAAMYRAKQCGRDNFQFYTEEMTASATERVVLEGQLSRAIRSGGLSVHYQPQFDLATGRLIGAEALVRWPHPELGLISPARFIPLAEESGLIVPLGTWVLRESCRQLAEWRAQGLPLERVSVNIAGQQIQYGDLLREVEHALEDYGLPATALELEVTETFIMQNARRAIDTLQQLRALGLTLAIDDFGTGYSSMGYLKKLPIQKLKLDQSFVRDIPADSNDAAIARAVIALGHSLGLDVVAEGVETEAQRDFLLAEGCRFGQGFLYARPLTPQAFLSRYAA